MRIKRIWKLAVLCSMLAVFSTDEVSAQDPQFTQFYANPLYLNPAFAGTVKCPRFAMNYRNQWPQLSGNFVTYSASYDQHVPVLSGGVGLLVTQDVAGKGTLKMTSATGIYSYQRPINRYFSIKIGLAAAFVQKSLDWGNLTFGDQIDTRRGFIYKTNEIARGGNKSFVDFSAGVLGFSDKFYFGAAAHHLNQPNESLILGTSRLPIRFTGHAGMVLPLAAKGRGTKESSISPNILYQVQDDFTQINIGVYIQKGPLVFGLWHRLEDSFIGLLGIHAGNMKIGYSYDLTTSKQTPTTGGAHEVSVSTTLKCKRRKVTMRAINCPSF